MDENFAARPGEWLAPDGTDNDIVISTRIRLARNVRGCKMPWRMTATERHELEQRLEKRILQCSAISEPRYWSVGTLTTTERQLLVERHLISRELAQGTGDRGVVFTPSEAVSIMTNEEDHMRIQVLRGGLQLDETWRQGNVIDSALEQSIPYAVSPRLGYLTTCPTNVGTGLRISVMLHLPTLVQSRQIGKVHNAASKVGLVVRGLYGEGTKASGDFYQISNQVTLGPSEEEILQEVGTMVGKIVEWERGLRNLLMEQDRVAMEDRIWRAFGALKFARMISSDETMKHLSSVRLGINTKTLNGVSLQSVTELFQLIQPAHLQVLRGGPQDAKERDIIRANFVRDWLNAQ